MANSDILDKLQVMIDLQSKTLLENFNKKTDDYTRWKKKFDVWETITDVAETKRGGILLLRLD